VEDALKRQSASKKKSKKTTEEPSTQDLTILHRRLSELHSATTEDLPSESTQKVNPEIEILKTEEVQESPIRRVMTDIPVEEKNEEIENLIESALDIRKEIDNLVLTKEMPADSYDQLLQSSMVC
jgi:hypothetical protein